MSGAEQRKEAGYGDGKHLDAAEPVGTGKFGANNGEPGEPGEVSATAVIGRLGRLNKAIGRRLDEMFARHDLESWELEVLASLLRTGAPHQLTPGGLLDSVMITSGAMTNRLDRLEKRRFVTRVKSPDDGRQVLVTLTDSGLAKVDAALIDHAENELRILEVLDSGQRRQLIELLQLLGRSLDQGFDPDRGPGPTVD